MATAHPLHLTLHLTRSCQLRCAYCYAPPRAGPPMSEQVAFTALELGVQANRGQTFGVAFFGGEPLLEKPLIYATVEHARHLRQERGAAIRFKITTNGLLLDDDFLVFAVRERVHVALSIDGIREAHDAQRRLPDGGSSYDQTLAALGRLLAAKPYSMVLMVVTPRTAPHLAASVEFMLDAGARYLSFTLDHAAPWTEEDFQVLEAGYERLSRLYVAATRAGRKFFLSPFETKLASHIQVGQFCKNRCELGQRQLSISPEGHIYPCVQFVETGPQGGWCLGHVSTGIDEQVRERIRLLSEEEKAACEGCVLQDRCRNTCGCLNHQTTGTVNGISPVVCRNEQLLVYAADRAGEVLFQERNALFLQKHYNRAWPLLSLLEDLGGAGLGGTEGLGE